MSQLRQSIRSLSRQRAFSASVILTTALGVGANAAVFAVVHALLLRDLPFKNAEQLVVVTESASTFDTGLVSPTAFLEWRDRNPPLSKMAAFMWWEGTGEDPTLTVSASKDYFDVLGVKPLLGRTFSDEDIRGGFYSAMILSYEFWQKQYGADPGVIGRTVGDRSTPIIGVMPPGPINLQIGWAHVWRPLRMRQELDRTQTTSARYVRVLGRLQPGMSRERAGAAMNVVQRQLQNEKPELFAGYQVRIASLRDTLAGEFGPALLILTATVGCLLLLACVSLANMLVARSAAHERESAIRIALGASRSSLIARLLLDNLVLAAIGAALGFVVCRLTIAGLAYFEPGIRVVASGAVYSWPVVSVCAGLSLLTALLVTAPVALGTGHASVHESLKDGGRSGTAGVRRQRIRGLLVSTEVALALCLLVVSGLLARSFVTLMNVNLGFQPDHVLLLESNIGDSAYNTGEKRLAYYRPLMQGIASLPGVASVGGLRYFPMHARLWTVSIRTRDNPERQTVYWNRVAGDYFAAMSIPLVAGRLPTGQEMWENGNGVLINASAARILFRGGNALGNRIEIEGDSQQVIGVVGDVRQARLGQPPGPEVYSLMGQGESTGILTIAIRTRAKPDANTMQSIVSAVRRYDAAQMQPVVTSLNSFLSDTVSARRTAARLGSAFAVLSLILSALGIYGLIAYWVTQRTAELGIRMALGASHGSVIRLVLAHGFRLTMTGIAIGLAISVLLARLISSFLYAVPALDPLTFGLAPVVLLLVALLAAALPAIRAIRINPLEALRSE